MGLGDLFCSEEPLARGLDGAVGENLTRDGLWLRLEFSEPCPDPLPGGVGLDVASALTFLRSFGLSWALWPPLVLLDATESEFRGWGTGMLDLTDTGGVLLPRFCPRELLLFSLMDLSFMEPFLPLRVFRGQVWGAGCLPDPGDDDDVAFSTRESCRSFAMLLILKSPLLEKDWLFPFRVLWVSEEEDKHT